MCRAYKNDSVSFLPVTYDLSYPNELENFINDYSNRNKITEKLKKELRDSDFNTSEDSVINDNILDIKDVKILKNDEKILNNGIKLFEKDILKNDNIWIMKRYRGRQSMDYPITGSLRMIMMIMMMMMMVIIVMMMLMVTVMMVIMVMIMMIVMMTVMIVMIMMMMMTMMIKI
jgi:hypothetical protein